MSIWKKPKNYIEKKYNYVYKLVLISDPRYFYIGKHSTNNLDDNYMGSGKKVLLLRKELGKNCFSKEILSFWDNVDDALLEEERIVSKELIENKFCLNTIVGGGSIDTTGLSHIVSDETKRKISKANSGRVVSDETKEKIRKSLLGRKVPLEVTEKIVKTKKELGLLKCSEETKKKIGDKNRGRKQDDKQKIAASKRHSGTIAVNKDGVVKFIKKDEFCDYKSNGWNKGTGKKMTKKRVEENKKMVSSLWSNESFRKNFSEKNKGLIFINNTIDEKKVKKTELENYLNNGWVLGRCKIKKRK